MFFSTRCNKNDVIFPLISYYVFPVQEFGTECNRYPCTVYSQMSSRFYISFNYCVIIDTILINHCLISNRLIALTSCQKTVWVTGMRTRHSFLQLVFVSTYHTGGMTTWLFITEMMLCGLCRRPDDAGGVQEPLLTLSI